MRIDIELLRIDIELLRIDIELLKIIKENIVTRPREYHVNNINVNV